MKRFIQGEDRSQSTLLPECLDDYIVGDNPVRVIEVFVNELDLGKLVLTGQSRRRQAGPLIIRRRCSRSTSTAI